MVKALSNSQNVSLDGKKLYIKPRISPSTQSETTHKKNEKTTTKKGSTNSVHDSSIQTLLNDIPKTIIVSFLILRMASPFRFPIFFACLFLIDTSFVKKSLNFWRFSLYQIRIIIKDLSYSANIFIPVTLPVNTRWFWRKSTTHN